MKNLTVPQENYKKSTSKYFTEKPMLPNFEYVSTIDLTTSFGDCLEFRRFVKWSWSSCNHSCSSFWDQGNFDCKLYIWIVAIYDSHSNA